MVRRHVIEELGCIYRDDIGLQGSDWEFSARVCQITKVGNVEESLVNVYVNHGKEQLTLTNAKHLDNLIIFHKIFLKTYHTVFESNPALAKYHVYSICIAYFKKKEIRNGLKYYRQLLLTKATIKELLIPLYVLLKE